MLARTHAPPALYTLTNKRKIDKGGVLSPPFLFLNAYMLRITVAVTYFSVSSLAVYASYLYCSHLCVKKYFKLIIITD